MRNRLSTGIRGTCSSPPPGQDVGGAGLRGGGPLLSTGRPWSLRPHTGLRSNGSWPWGWATKAGSEGRTRPDRAEADEPAPEEAPDSPTVRDRLQEITPEKLWGMDLEGKVRFWGRRLDGSESSSGFTTRYSWEVTDDLDAGTITLGINTMRRKEAGSIGNGSPCFLNPRDTGRISTPDRHRPHTLALLAVPAGGGRGGSNPGPAEAEGKVRSPPLRSISGDRWLILGLPTDLFEKNT